MFGPRAFYILALLLIIGGVAAYTRDPDWTLPNGQGTARVAAASRTEPDAGAASAAGQASPVKPAASSQSTFRRISTDARETTASVETSRPSSASAAGLLGDGDSAAKPASSRKPAVDSGSSASARDGSDAAASGAPETQPNPQAAQADKEHGTSAEAEDAKPKARHAKRVPRPRVRTARRHGSQPWERQRTVVAGSSAPAYSSAYPGYSGYSGYYNACRLEARWAMTAVGYQQVWVRVCD